MSQRRPPQSGPYRLEAHFVAGHFLIVGSGHNPSVVRGYERRVSRNPRVISRIVLCDGTGPLETIWDRNWERVDA